MVCLFNPYSYMIKIKCMALSALNKFDFQKSEADILRLSLILYFEFSWSNWKEAGR